MEPHAKRLSLMMFGQYLGMGAWAVTLATYLMAPPTQGGLHFPAGLAGWIYTTLAIAGIVAPFFTGLLADRLFSAQKLLGVLHLLGAVLLGGIAWWCQANQPEIADVYQSLAAEHRIDGLPLLEAELLTNRPDLHELIRDAQEQINAHPQMRDAVGRAFGPLFVLMIIYAFSNVLSLTLTNVIAMRNLNDPQRNFSRVRLWGTVGWIVTGLLVELGMRPISSGPLYLAAGISVAVGLYCFTLPSTPPAGVGKSLAESFGLPALRLFANRSFLVLILCSFAVAVTQQFYVVYTNRFLTELQIPSPAATQTLAQVTEVICMAVFTFIVPRLGLKWMMVLGMFALALRNGIFALGEHWTVSLIGLPLHGFSYAFFYVSAAIYVDRQAPPQLRASAQGIVTFISMGGGTFLGSWLGGLTVDAHTHGNAVAWSHVWILPAVACLAISILFTWFFRRDT